MLGEFTYIPKILNCSYLASLASLEVPEIQSRKSYIVETQ
jgi:hypothetical protein